MNKQIIMHDTKNNISFAIDKETLKITISTNQNEFQKIAIIFNDASQTVYNMDLKYQTNDTSIYAAFIKDIPNKTKYAFLLYNKEGTYLYNKAGMTLYNIEKGLNEAIKDIKDFFIINELDSSINSIWYQLNPEYFSNDIISKIAYLKKLGITNINLTSSMDNNSFKNLTDELKKNKIDLSILKKDSDSINLDSIENLILKFVCPNYSDQIDAEGFKNSLINLLINNPKLKLNTRINQLSSSNTPSLLWYCNNIIQLMKMAYLMLFSLPGHPAIYYGDEISLISNDKTNNKVMIWDEDKQDLDMFYFIQTLITYRKTSEDFSSFDFKFLFADNDILIYQKGSTYFLYNRSNAAKLISLPIELQNKKVYSVFCNSDKSLRTSFVLGAYHFYCFEEI